MAKVYFAKNIEKILDSIDYSKIKDKVGIKVHFGERGCNTFISPALVRKVFEKMKKLGKEVNLIESNVLYKGSRTNTRDHKKTAIEHGFTDMTIDILDGETGKDYVEVNGCKLGKHIKNYDSLIVLTHFKGHMFTGFGGSIKNVGMGIGSRAGKLYMHSKIKPMITDSCIACGVCVKNCDVKAIKIIDKKAKIDENICVGCAMCIAVCEFGAAQVPWHGGTTGELHKKIAEYTKAVLSLFPNAIFINVMEKITVECDCMGVDQTPMMQDVGILCSDDIVAIDKASLDLANKYSDGKFEKINQVNKKNQISEAEKIGLGKSDYELIQLK